MENGTFAPQEQMSIFHNIKKNRTFKWRPKALVGSIGLNISIYMYKYCRYSLDRYTKTSGSSAADTFGVKHCIEIRT